MAAGSVGPPGAAATGVMVLLLAMFLHHHHQHGAEAHVSLTFPPARKYDLDFLDNSRTKAPCGMPKDDTTARFQ
uniref:Uncharacterized protein n=1 Tax=Anopheles dirus TaxID=7168 RepID=A0A182NHN5_9DIPT